MPADFRAAAKPHATCRDGAGIGVVPTGAALGAEIRGVDLSRPLAGTLRAAIAAAFDVHSVLLFRDWVLSAGQLRDFARHFGATQVIPYLRHYAHPDHLVVMLVSNIREDGRNIGHADAARVWHSDPWCTNAHIGSPQETP